MSTQNYAYHQVRQKSSHNSYQRDESYTCQALFWRIRSLEIDIHNSNDKAGWPGLNGNWYVYHVSVFDQGTSVNTLADALDVLKSFHKAVPDHEVMTIWLDLKDSFNTATNQTPESLDQLLIDKLGRAAIWGAPDLIGDAPNLQEAVKKYGWPSLDSLKGKFIFGCTTGDLSSPDSHLNQYVQNGKTANKRLAFVAPEISDASQITPHDYAVFFNLDNGNSHLGVDVAKAGFISRAYGLNSKGDWCNAWKSQVNHLATDKINTFSDAWARTDLPDTGYPFTGINVQLPSDLTEAGPLNAIKVKSGDIWGREDSFFFAYDDLGTDTDRTIEAFVCSQQSHVDEWIKGGIMARSSTADSAPYVAVLATAGKGIFLQFRNRGGQNTDHIAAHIPSGVNGKSIVSAETPIWLRLTISQDGKSASGSYSIDGSTWKYIGQSTSNERLSLQGWAGSSHGDDQVKWLFGGMTAPSQSGSIGEDASGSYTTDTAKAANLGPLTDRCS